MASTAWLIFVKESKSRFHSRIIYIFYSLNDMCRKKASIYSSNSHATNTITFETTFWCKWASWIQFQISVWFFFFSFPFMFCFVLFCLFQPKFEQRRQTIFWLVQTNPIVYRATYALVVCHQTDERCDYILIGPSEKLKMCWRDR